MYYDIQQNKDPFMLQNPIANKHTSVLRVDCAIAEFCPSLPTPSAIAFFLQMYL